MKLVFEEKIREIWIDEHHRALAIPLTSGITVLSIDVYFRKWIYPVSDKISLNGEELVYYRVSNPKDIGLRSYSERIVRAEVVGHLGEEVSEIISLRLWVKGEEGLEDLVKTTYLEFLKHLKSESKSLRNRL